MVLSSTPRLLAAASLAANGAFVLVLALAIALARVLVALVAIRPNPADAALLEDLVAVLPFVITFGVALLTAALGIVRVRTWADWLAIGLATVGATVATIGLLLMGVGRDSLPTASPTAPVDGLVLLAVVLTTHLITVAALWVAPGARAGHLAD